MPQIIIPTSSGANVVFHGALCVLVIKNSMTDLGAGVFTKFAHITEECQIC